MCHSINGNMQIIIEPLANFTYKRVKGCVVIRGQGLNKRCWTASICPATLRSRQQNVHVVVTGRKRTLALWGVIEIQRLPVAVALKFTVHGVQSFIKGHKIWSDFNKAF